jgi:hypothetical protein
VSSRWTRCTVKKTLALALEKGADVLMQVKGYQPTLLTACERRNLPDSHP